MARRPARRLLVVPQRRQALEKIVLHATSLRIPIVEVEGGSLTALTGFDGHQGVALVVESRRFATIDDVLARAAERGEPPFVLVLDSLEDPHNVGSLLRSAEGAGVHGVLFPVRRQAPLTPSAIKASAGAVEHLLLCPVDDLASALVDLHGHGVWVAGADGDAPLTARQTDLRGPIALVVGSEGQGLGPAVRKRCDLFVRIPLRGAIGSLNAAVAGSVLLFEVAAQRDPDGTAGRPVARNVRPAIIEADGPSEASADGAGDEAPAEAEAQPAVSSKTKGRRTPRTKAEPKAAQPPTAGAGPKAVASTRPKTATKSKAVATATSEPKAKAPAKAASTAKPKSTTKVTAKPKAEVTPNATAKPKSTAKPRTKTTPKPAAKATASAEPKAAATARRRMTSAPASDAAILDDGDDLLPE